MSESTPLLPAYSRPANVKPKKKAVRIASVAKPKAKLDTFEGVFLPTSLNVLSILMFLRFGFIIGQMGIMGTILLLVMSYVIDILTVLSVSAISTNGTVKGGGAYYMISRSLGPEFGGAIGIIFFIGQILNASLNVVGFIEPLLVNFGKVDGDIMTVLPVSYAWQVLYLTILLAFCTGVAMVGSSLVSKTAFWLFVILTVSTLSIPVSAIFARPGYPLAPPLDDLKYTGICWETITENLWPHFTSGAAGSVQPPGVPETFKNLFGIFFPATAGIFAGASMSGELKNPSKSIPQGTLKGLLASFILYSLVIVSLGASTPRTLLHKDIKIIQSVNLNGLVIILGEVSTSLFSVIMGVVGAASMLNAIADDKIIPGLSVFSLARKSPGEKRKAEIYSIVFTWFLAQVFLFADINQIATFITMAFLMTFLVTNLACFLLKVGSAPNFRPSFKYFSSQTAFTGGLVSVLAMYLVDGVSATSVIICLIFLILMIHYSTPPLKFGDISQLLIYHQVRKYLLRLKLQMSVKYWRPQILLLCDDPRTSWNLIGFCNHLKKGGLYILGHVVLLEDDAQESGSKPHSLEFNVLSFKEVQKQKNAWVKLRDLAKIKAFVQIAIGPSLPWGVRNVFLGSGLGGMKPNITVIGFYDFHKRGVGLPLLPRDLNGLDLHLPTDDCRKEQKVSINQWVQIVEDLVIMQATVAVAANFRNFEVPVYEGKWFKESLRKKNSKCKYIDLYPIQMSSICLLDDGKSVLSTNFDTYTLILQLGYILSTVDEWKKNGYTLRIIAFVETKSEEEEEKRRLSGLLESLRIVAELKIVCFDDGSLSSYNYLVKGYNVTPENKSQFQAYSDILEEDQWWTNLVEARRTLKTFEKQRAAKKRSVDLGKSKAISISEDRKFDPINLTARSPSELQSVGKSLKNRRYTLSNLHDQGLSLSLNMNAQGGDKFFNYDDSSSSDSESERDLGNSGIDSDASSLNLLDPPQAPTPTPPPSRIPAAVQNRAPQPPKMTMNPTFKAKYLGSLKNASSDQLSVRSSRSNLRPNFLAVKIPELKVRDDEDDEAGEDNDEDPDNKPSITFVEDGEDGSYDEVTNTAEADNDKDILNSEETSEEQEDTRFAKLEKIQLRLESSGGPLKPLKKEPGYFDLAVDSGANIRSPIITNDGIDHSHFINDDDDSSSKDNDQDSKAKTKSEKSEKITYKQLLQELKGLTFNDLPAKGQHVILNELMKINSPKDETAVIFSTLPAPAIGTHLHDEESFDYTNGLAIWLDNLPPVILINSQTVTVTTAL